MAFTMRSTVPIVGALHFHCALSKTAVSLSEWFFEKLGEITSCSRLVGGFVRQTGAPALDTLFHLLGHIQQHSHTGQCDKQRRSAIGNEWKRNAFCRHQSENNADVNERLQHDHAGDPNS